MRTYSSACYFTSGAIGEFLMTLYFADVIAHSAGEKNIPVPTVYVVVQRNLELLTELAQDYPHVRVISMSRRAVLKTIYGVRKGATPQVIITQQTFGRIPLSIKVVAWTCSWGGKRDLVGFDDHQSINRYLYTKVWKFNEKRLFTEEMETLADRIGYRYENLIPHLQWSGVQQSVVDNPYIVMHVCAGGEKRSFPAKRWIQLIEKMRLAHPDTPFVFTGSREDQGFIDSVISGVLGCENKAGNLSTHERIDLLRRAVVFLGVDTGITHLAAFLGVSTVVIGNNSNPCWSTKYSPKSIWLVSLERCTCLGNKKGDCSEYIDGKAYYRCMLDISDEEILEAIHSRLHVTSGIK